MSDLSAFSGTQKLVRCQVGNRKGESSTRYVELENFQLWRHMMDTKHGLQVSEVQLCLWIGSDEFHAKEALYSRAGRQEQVTRLIVLLYDSAASYCHTIQRFAPEADAEMVRDSLEACVPETFRSGNRFELHRIDGYCINHDPRGAASELILGLSTFEEHPA